MKIRGLEGTKAHSSDADCKRTGSSHFYDNVCIKDPVTAHGCHWTLLSLSILLSHEGGS